MNTTCPANQKVQGADRFTDEDIEALMKFDPTQVEPCPVVFHLARVHITRLRFTLSEYKTSQEQINLALKVLEIFDRICLFELEPWIKEKFGDKDQEKQDYARIMARIYAVAIRLYGILTLPRSAVIAWVASSADIRSAYPILPDLGIYESLRVHHREGLLQMLRKQWDGDKLKHWLGWPFLVLGVAVADDVENQRFVNNSLLEIWKIPSVTNSFISVLDKLRVFWASGSTEWDDCFDEPVPSAVNM